MSRTCVVFYSNTYPRAGGVQNVGFGSKKQGVPARPADTNAARKFRARAGLLFAVTRKIQIF